MTSQEHKDLPMSPLRSSLIPAPFVHGFTTRHDDHAALFQNGLWLFRAHQVHGCAVLEVHDGLTPEAVRTEPADAVVATTPGLAVGVVTADCVPILLCAPERRAFAAVHAGWRGTVARAAAAAVEALAARAGSRPSALLAAIGPSIGPCCYEVAPELAARFEEDFGEGVVDRSRPAPRLDLWEANARALGAAGLLPERIDRLGRCTACEHGLFFSHRRDAGATGRQVAWIAPAAAAPDIAGGAVP